MSSTEDEEEGGSRGRPNAYFADLDKEAARLGFGGNYRGVSVPHGGQQRVHAEDTLGSLDTCWCGEPEGHDWPGKDKGRRHPKEKKVSAAVAEDKPHITRRDLPGFDDDTADVVIRAVNDYGARYRSSRRGVMLYPPDGSASYSVSAQTNARGLKAFRRWFVMHCVPVDQARAFIHDGEVLVDDMHQREMARKEEVEVADVVELAEALNSPEHPVAAETRRRSEAASAAHARRVETQAAAIEAQAQAAIRSTEDDDWEPWRARDRHGKPGAETDENYLQRGEEIKCVRCDTVLTRRGKAGHELVHDQAKRDRLYSPESQEKKRNTMAMQAAHAKVRQSIAILYDVLGEKPGDEKKIEELEAKVAQLQETLASAKRSYDKVADERDEYKARLDLLREAMRA